MGGAFGLKRTTTVAAVPAIAPAGARARAACMLAADALVVGSAAPAAGVEAGWTGSAWTDDEWAGASWS